MTDIAPNSVMPFEATPMRLHGPTALLAKGTALLALALATVLGIFAFVPDGNDYAQASVLKHARLANTLGRRIVLVGGSNLAFGVDSTILERATGCQVVNMGMNGYLGVKFMLEEIAPYLRPSDIVVTAFEHDNYHKSVRGTPADLLMIVKARPASFFRLDLSQRLEVIKAIPYVAQRKVFRLTNDSLRTVFLQVYDPQVLTELDLDNIESVSGFTKHGDLVSHLGIQWPYGIEDGADITRLPRDADVIPLLQRFTLEFQARGIHMLVSHTSVMKEYYARHQRTIDETYAIMRKSPPLVVLSPPAAYVYDEDLFFDTVYHLNARGRKLRSERLARDILQHFGSNAPCPSALFSAPLSSVDEAAT